MAEFLSLAGIDIPTELSNANTKPQQKQSPKKKGKGKGPVTAASRYYDKKNQEDKEAKEAKKQGEPTLEELRQKFGVKLRSTDTTKKGKKKKGKGRENDVDEKDEKGSGAPRISGKEKKGYYKARVKKEEEKRERRKTGGTVKRQTEYENYKEETKRVQKEIGNKMKKYQRPAPFVPFQVGQESEGWETTEIKKDEREVARAEILQPSEAGYLIAEGLNKTWQFRQDQIKENLDAESAKKIFNLKLDEFGPYTHDYTANGRYLLLGGRKGHVTVFDSATFRLNAEFHVKETVRDVHFLHDHTLYAVAQKKDIYIYDYSGLEVHRLQSHRDAWKMEYLPYHFLLVSVGKNGYLRYHDTSIGEQVKFLRTKLGDCDVIRQNKKNAIIHLGHKNGVVSLWSPNSEDAIVKIFTHKAPVLSLAIDPEGVYMATSSLDSTVKIWDLRTYKEVHSYFTVRPTNTMDISDRGLLALGFGPHVQIWNDAFVKKQTAPYLAELIPGKDAKTVKFRPYEDVLGVGHSSGFTTMVVPGSGEPNFDTFVANPFEGKKQRRERVVHQLLDKLKYDMITLDPIAFGRMDDNRLNKLQADKDDKEAKEFLDHEKNKKLKHKARGKSKSSKNAVRKKANIEERKRKEIQKKDMQKVKRQKLQKEEQKKKEKKEGKTPAMGYALGRFQAKK